MVQANYRHKGIAGVCVDIQSEERGPSVRAGPSGRPGISRQSMQSMSVADSGPKVTISAARRIRPVCVLWEDGRAESAQFPADYISAGRGEDVRTGIGRRGVGEVGGGGEAGSRLVEGERKLLLCRQNSVQLHG